MKNFSKYLSFKIEFLLIPLLAIRHIFEISEEVHPYTMTPLWTSLILSFPPVPFLRNFHLGGGGGGEQRKKAERKI